MATPIEIALVVKDELSLTVMARVVSATGRDFNITRALVERGFGNIRHSIVRYRAASRIIPHVVLTDLDASPCPGALLAGWGAVDLPSTMLVRVAVREVEAWLLADRPGFARFAGLAAAKIPRNPESLPDPKQALVNLVRRSRRRRLVAELVPPQGSRLPTGPMYNRRLGRFAAEAWNIEAARRLAPSLERAIERLSSFLLPSG